MGRGPWVRWVGEHHAPATQPGATCATTRIRLSTASVVVATDVVEVFPFAPRVVCDREVIRHDASGT